jgi:hypothetical protein
MTEDKYEARKVVEGIGVLAEHEGFAPARKDFRDSLLIVGIEPGLAAKRLH